MENLSKWSLSDEEKDELIAKLMPELVPLRTKAEISQEDLAGLIGVSRQTYSAIERRVRKMSWNTYLSLILFYDYNQKTHQVLRAIGIFPYDVIKKFNQGAETQDLDLSAFFGEGLSPIIEKLDEQALRSIRTMIMVEYARCTATPGDVVVKSFDGFSFTPPNPEHKTATEALKAIKETQNGHDQS